MKEFEAIWVADLDQLSIEEARARVLLEFKDPENLTDEHIARLRARVHAADASCDLDLDSLDDKLRHLSRRVSASSSRSFTPDAPNGESFQEERLRIERMVHQMLLEDGGRASHDPHAFADFDFIEQHESGIIWYWRSQRAQKEFVVQAQWDRWLAFRRYQDRIRASCEDTEAFTRLVSKIKIYRKAQGLEGDISLFQDRTLQGRLDDWKEFQAWVYTDNDVPRRALKSLTIQKQALEKRLQVAIDAGKSTDETAAIRKDIRGLEQPWAVNERHFQQSNVLLAWIAEQIPIIEAEEALLHSNSLTDDQPAQQARSSPRLGKRKRSLDADLSAPQKIPRLTDIHTPPCYRPNETHAPASGTQTSCPKDPPSATLAITTTRDENKQCPPNIQNEPTTKLSAPSPSQSTKLETRRSTTTRRSTRKPSSRVSDSQYHIVKHLKKPAKATKRSKPTTDFKTQHLPSRNASLPAAKHVGKPPKRTKSVQGSIRRSARIAQKPVVHYPK